MAINDREKYLFDLQGYLIVPGFLSADELAALNGAVDANMDKRHANETPKGTWPESMRGDDIDQGVFGGMMEWAHPWCDPFRALIAHPRLIPYLNEFLGRGWHMDTPPALFHSTKG